MSSPDLFNTDIICEILHFLDIWDAVSLLMTFKWTALSHTEWFTALSVHKSTGLPLACPPLLDITTLPSFDLRRVAYRTASIQRNLGSAEVSGSSYAKCRSFRTLDIPPEDRLFSMIEGTDLFLTSKDAWSDTPDDFLFSLRCWDMRTGKHIDAALFSDEVVYPMSDPFFLANGGVVIPLFFAEQSQVSKERRRWSVYLDLICATCYPTSSFKFEQSIRLPITWHYPRDPPRECINFRVHIAHETRIVTVLGRFDADNFDDPCNHYGWASFALDDASKMESIHLELFKLDLPEGVHENGLEDFLITTNTPNNLYATFIASSWSVRRGPFSMFCLPSPGETLSVVGTLSVRHPEISPFSVYPLKQPRDPASAGQVIITGENGSPWDGGNGILRKFILFGALNNLMVDTSSQVVFTRDHAISERKGHLQTIGYTGRSVLLLTYRTVDRAQGMTKRKFCGFEIITVASVTCAEKEGVNSESGTLSTRTCNLQTPGKGRNFDEFCQDGTDMGYDDHLGVVVLRSREGKWVILSYS